MYFYYIAMEIYVLGCTSTFSPFYCLCIGSEPYHFPTTNYTQSTPKNNMCVCIGNEPHHFRTMNYTQSTPKTFVYA
jgi:hypothetical protein